MSEIDASTVRALLDDIERLRAPVERINASIAQAVDPAPGDIGQLVGRAITLLITAQTIRGDDNEGAAR